MTTDNIGLFKALGAKMDYLNERQRIVSQNIANADTPRYRPQDLKEMDFGAALKNVTGDTSIRMVSTSSKHFPVASGDLADPKSAASKDVYEVTPTGNAVVMEEQLMKAGQTLADYNLVASLYQKNVRMIQTALGRGA